MKTKIRKPLISAGSLFAAIALVMGAPVSTFGEQAGSAGMISPPSASGREDISPRDLAALERFLTMSDEELDRLQTALARIRAMSEEERRRFAEHVMEYRKLPREDRQMAREGWGWQDERDREDWRRMMQDLTPAERRQVHEGLQDLSSEERIQRRLELIDNWRKATTGKRDK